MSAAEIIRDACERAQERGIALRSGPWFEFRGDRIVSCCAIGAVLLAGGVEVKPVLDGPRGYVRAACELLAVNGRWLYRFWMGFDRGYQVLIESKDKDELTKDDVSALGIEVAREFAGAV